MLIDLANWQLFLDGVDDEGEQDDCLANSICTLRVKENIIWPPRSEVSVSLIADPPILKGPLCLVEPNISLVAKQSIVVPYRLVGISDNHTTVRVTNASLQLQVLSRGSQIAIIDAH